MIYIVLVKYFPNILKREQLHQFYICARYLEKHMHYHTNAIDDQSPIVLKGKKKKKGTFQRNKLGLNVESMNRSTSFNRIDK
jgi:hypothetical protein